MRKYSNEFLNIGVDAAALGMSNAVVATTDDVNSGYWNPAGLVYLEDNQLSLMHASYFANIANYNYLAYAMPLDDRSAVGISVIRFGVDDILDTTQLIDDQGNIKQLKTREEEIIEGDFFVDCTGFASILMQKTLQVPFHNLLMNSSQLYLSPLIFEENRNK